jgi:hypothetical protein
VLALTESMFYYFLVDIDGSPHSQAVLTTFDPNRHVGELLELEDGSEVRVRGIEVSVEAHIAGRGFDGVLVVESQD